MHLSNGARLSSRWKHWNELYRAAGSIGQSAFNQESKQSNEKLLLFEASCDPDLLMIPSFRSRGLNTHPVFEHTPQFGFWFPRTIRTKGCISVLPYFRMHNCTSVAFICLLVIQTTKHEYIKCWLLVGLITTLKCWKNPILYLMAVSNEVPWEGCTWCRLSMAGAFPFEASFQQMVEMVVVRMIPNMLMKVLGSWWRWWWWWWWWSWWWWW